MATDDIFGPEYWADPLLENLSSEPEMTMTPDFVDKCRALFTHLLTDPEWVLSRESLDAYRQYNIDIPEFGPWAWWDTSIFDNYRKGEVVMYIDDPLAFLGAIPGEEGAYLLALYTTELMGVDQCP